MKLERGMDRNGGPSAVWSIYDYFFGAVPPVITFRFSLFNLDSLMILFSVLIRLKHEYILYEYVRTRLDTQYRHCRIAGRGHATIDR